MDRHYLVLRYSFRPVFFVESTRNTKGYQAIGIGGPQREQHEAIVSYKPLTLGEGEPRQPNKAFKDN